LPWQHPLSNQKKLNGVNKPLHPSTNPEILVKIDPSDTEKQPVENRPLQIFLKKKEKHWQNI